MSIENDKVIENLPLVYSLVNRVLYPKFKDIYSIDELIQTGSLGLISAVSRFDESKGIKFSTYASRFIIGYVYNYLHSDKFQYIRSTNGELERVIVSSLDTPISYESTNDTCLLDTIEDKNNPYTLLETKELMDAALEILTEKERSVINYRYMLGYSSRKTGEILGYSLAYIYKLNRKALKKLKKYIEMENLANE